MARVSSLERLRRGDTATQTPFEARSAPDADRFRRRRARGSDSSRGRA